MLYASRTIGPWKEDCFAGGQSARRAGACASHAYIAERAWGSGSAGQRDSGPVQYRAGDRVTAGEDVLNLGRVAL